MTKRVLWLLALLALVWRPRHAAGPTTARGRAPERARPRRARARSSRAASSASGRPARSTPSTRSSRSTRSRTRPSSSSTRCSSSTAPSSSGRATGPRAGRPPRTASPGPSHLRPGSWSDGTPLTAEDAVWTGETVLKYADGPTSILAPFLSHVKSLEAPDPQTLVITYDQPVGERPPAAAAVLRPPEARVGAARRRRRQGTEAVQPAGRPAGRGRRTLRDHQVRQEGHDDLREEPELLRDGAERRRGRLPALRERGRAARRLRGRRARLPRGGAVERGRAARGRRGRRPSARSSRRRSRTSSSTRTPTSRKTASCSTRRCARRWSTPSTGRRSPRSCSAGTRCRSPASSRR